MAGRASLVRLFGSRVREERVRKGWSQERLAEHAELDRTYVSGIERGVRNPSLANVEKIANALEVKASALLSKT